MLFNILSHEIQFCRDCAEKASKIRQRYDFSIQKVINNLCGKQVVSKENLKNYFGKNGHPLEEEEVDLLLTKLSENETESLLPKNILKGIKLTRNDFANEIMLKYTSEVDDIVMASTKVRGV